MPQKEELCTAFRSAKLFFALKLQQMSNLCLAADTSEENWLTRLGRTDGVDGMFERFEKDYPTLSESRLTTLLRSEYDESAKVLAEKLADLRTSLKSYTDCEVKAEDIEEKIKTYFEAHPNENSLAWFVAGTEYKILTETKAEDKSLFEFINDEENTFDNADDRIALYPIIEAMSEGQRALLPYVDIGEMIVNGNIDDEGWKNALNENEKTSDSGIAASIYFGVDRSDFQPAKIALTSEARKLESATGSSYAAKVFGIKTSYIMFAGYSAFVVTLAAGLAALGHGSNLRYPAEQLLSANDEFDKCAGDAAAKLKAYLSKNDIIGVNNTTVNDNVSRQENLLNSLETELINDKEAVVKVTRKNDLLKYEEKKVTDILDEFKRESNENKTAYEQFKAAHERAAEVSEKYNDITEEELSRNLNDGIWWTKAGTVLCIAAALIAIGSAVVTAYDIYKYYHKDYAPIPRKIVHESTDEKRRSIYTVYNVTRCNREEQGFGKAELEDHGDMNGDVGKEWLALYTTRDKAAGDPITADIVVQKGTNKLPVGKNASITLFGSSDSLDAVDVKYNYNNSVNGIFNFFGTASDSSAPNGDKSISPAPESSAAETVSKAEMISEDEQASDTAEAAAGDGSSEAKATSAGSVVGTGTMIASCMGSAAIGALICFLIARRKRENAA